LQELRCVENRIHNRHIAMTPGRSDHFNGKTFFNPHPVERTWRDLLRWRRTSRPTPWPARVTVAPQPPPTAPSGSDAGVVTWIGHATFLVQTARGTLLTDPQFSECCGPFGRFGPRRVHPPGVALTVLPRIDLVLLSHDHYDHCDLPSLRALARRHDPLVVAPLGHRQLLARAGLRRVVELDWWQSHATDDGFDLTLTPARHWSNRLSGTRNARLWGGFFARWGGRTFWFAGDTGYDPVLFRSIHDRLGAPDLAMIPIGAYEPRWFMSPLHCNPAEAVQIHRDLGAEQSLAMHWGCWQLTDEGRDEPVRALAAARDAAGVSASQFRVLAPGESIEV
jgi:L-ascorbate metabolism protein UlaG (beta-lactamase superfamily)